MQKTEDVILFQIDLTSKVSKQYSQKEFDRLGLGITVDQWVILKIVSENIGLSQKELATKSVRDPASITRTIDLLEKKGLLVRESIPKNRRAYNISLTKGGEKFVEKNIEMVLAHRKLSIEGISTDELLKLSELLERIRENMR